MGAWGDKPFENDAAVDWLAELEEHGVAALRETLNAVAETDGADYLDVDDGSAAIAAAEIVAAGLRRRAAGTAEARRRLAAQLGFGDRSSDRELARRAVERVLAPQSELRGLWDDAGSESGWHAAVGELLERLGGDASAIASGEEDGGAKPTWSASRWCCSRSSRPRGLEPTAAQRARIVASEESRGARAMGGPRGLGAERRRRAALTPARSRSSPIRG